MERRTQAERRAATRKSLIDAASELLVEQGWAQVTSVAVCARADLTRGAFVHHFANDPDLGRMLRPVVTSFAKLFGPDRWLDLLRDEDSRAFFLVARESLLGLAWGRAINGGRPLGHEAVVLDHLTSTAKAHDARLGRKGEQP